MIKNYSNQNHGISRNDNPLSKTASIYDQMGVSNRVEKSRVFSFSTLPPLHSEGILEKMKKEAIELSQGMTKQANIISDPFEVFGQTKNYIASKLGVSSGIAHDLASSVVAKGQEFQSQHGGDLGEMAKGIVDQMDPNQIQQRIGASPMKKQSPNEMEEMVKERLMTEMQMTAHQADIYKKIVMQQARNLMVQYRSKDLSQIAEAIVDVVVQHRDASIAYGISSSDRLRGEIEMHLNQR